MAQGKLDFTRGEQLALRRDILLPPGEKFLLWILDDHIGSCRSWVMSMAQLQEESGFGRSAVYNFVNRLCDRGLVWWDELPDKRRDFRICWTNVAEQIEAQSASTNPPGGNAVHDVDAPVHQVESESTTWTLSPRRGRASPPGGLHIMNSAPSSAQLTPSSSPSAPPACEAAPIEPSRPAREPTVRTDEDDDRMLRSRTEEPDRSRREAVLREVQATGLGAFVQAMQQAEARGLSLEQIAAVAEFYRRHPGRWPPEVLFHRLTSPQALLLAPHEGWFGELPAWTARQRREAQERTQQAARDSPRRATEPSEEMQRLEAEFGPELDAMTPEAAAGLFPVDSPNRVLVVKHGVQIKLLRRSLLMALQQRKGS